MEDVSPVQSDDGSGNYARLLAVLAELDQEFDRLEKEGQVLRAEIQSAVDRDKIKNVLKKIVTQR